MKNLRQTRGLVKNKTEKYISFQQSDCHSQILTPELLAAKSRCWPGPPPRGSTCPQEGADQARWPAETAGQEDSRTSWQDTAARRPPSDWHKGWKLQGNHRKKAGSALTLISMGRKNIHQCGGILSYSFSNESVGFPQRKLQVFCVLHY